jgi:hypothetical protein
MPIEGEFGELDLGRIREGCNRTEGKSTVCIVTATDNISRIVERRAT